MTSDLHMSAKKDPADAIVSLMKMQREVFDIFFKEVCAKADLLILSGDNTQSGSMDDMKMLQEYLRELNDQGTEILMTTGNHDFDSGTEEQYEEMFFPLLKPDVKDPFSLSYTRSFGPYRFLCMDDHEGGRSTAGILKPETVKWLKRQLKEAEKQKQKVIFLSHHNLHQDSWMGRPSFYCLQPPGIRDLLARHHVRLAFSGHLHDPKIYQSSLYEVITPILLGGAHMYGELVLHEDQADYRLTKLEVSDPLLKAKIAQKDAAALASRRAVFEKLLAEQLHDTEKEKALDGLMMWLRANQEGRLYETRDELQAHEGLQCAVNLLKDNAYGRWIQALSKESCPSCSRLATKL